MTQKMDTTDTAKMIDSSDERKISTVIDQQRVAALDVRMVCSIVHGITFHSPKDVPKSTQNYCRLEISTKLTMFVIEELEWLKSKLKLINTVVNLWIIPMLIFMQYNETISICILCNFYMILYNKPISEKLIYILGILHYRKV